MLWCVPPPQSPFPQQMPRSLSHGIRNAKISLAAIEYIEIEPNRLSPERSCQHVTLHLWDGQTARMIRMSGGRTNAAHPTVWTFGPAMHLDNRYGKPWASQATLRASKSANLKPRQLNATPNFHGSVHWSSLSMKVQLHTVSTAMGKRQYNIESKNRSVMCRREGQRIGRETPKGRRGCQSSSQWTMGNTFWDG